MQLKKETKPKQMYFTLNKQSFERDDCTTDRAFFCFLNNHLGQSFEER